VLLLAETLLQRLKPLFSRCVFVAVKTATHKTFSNCDLRNFFKLQATNLVTQRAANLLRYCSPQNHSANRPQSRAIY
jgi:hypothetical protein